MLLLIFLTTNSFVKCCNYEVFTDLVWPQFSQQQWRIKGGLSGPCSLWNIYSGVFIILKYYVISLEMIFMIILL